MISQKIMKKFKAKINFTKIVNTIMKFSLSKRKRDASFSKKDLIKK